MVPDENFWKKTGNITQKLDTLQKNWILNLVETWKFVSRLRDKGGRFGWVWENIRFFRQAPHPLAFSLISISRPHDTPYHMASWYCRF